MVGYATAQGVKDLEGKNVELHTGVYVPPVSRRNKEAIELARANGAKGIAFYDGNDLTEAQWKAIKESKK